MTEITPEIVKKIERLARLRSDDAQTKKYAEQINSIVHWVEQLQEVDTENVPPLPSPVDISLPQRADEVNDGNCQDKVLANAPETLEGFYVVPKVVE